MKVSDLYVKCGSVKIKLYCYFLKSRENCIIFFFYNNNNKNCECEILELEPTFLQCLTPPQCSVVFLNQSCSNSYLLAVTFLKLII